MAQVRRFLVRSAVPERGDASARGPLTVEAVRTELTSGVIDRNSEVQLEGHAHWATIKAWADFELPCDPPARHVPERMDLPQSLGSLESEEILALRWWVRDGGRTHGPIAGDKLAEELRERVGAAVMIAMVGGDAWFPKTALREVAPEIDGWRGVAMSEGATMRCAVCLETIPAAVDLCPECGERPDGVTSAPVTARSGETSLAPITSQKAPSSRPKSAPPSIPDDPPGASWMRMHWRPVMTMGVIGSLLGAGIVLRNVAPDRYQPPARMVGAAAQPSVATVCEENACWHGESCQVGQCVWQAPSKVGHIPSTLTIAGPFELPRDVSDVLPLDEARYAVSYLKGVQITSARTGEVLSLVNDAPHAQQLHRVGDVVYATSPRRTYVIDAASTRVLKTIELGSPVSNLAVGAGGRRVLVSLPGKRAVAVIATDYHAEVARFHFGDDHVRPIAIDDSGERALVTNGHRPLAGLRPSRESRRYGAMYAFDPSRLPSEQDRVRTGLVGNPVDVLMLPDGKTSYAVMREKDEVVRFERLASGAVRQLPAFHTCDQPEQMLLIPDGRRAIVRCNAGRALEIFNLEKQELVRHIPLNAHIADMVVTPDAKQAILALPRDGAGAVALLDLETYGIKLHELGAEPHRLRLTPDGKSVLVISDRSKVAWVIR